MKNLLLLIFSVAAPLFCNAQDITGQWYGKAQIPGNGLRISFNIEQKEDGLYTGTMDSPDQGAKGIPITKVELQDDKLTIGISNIGFEYNGTVYDNGTIEGSFSQSGYTFELNLSREEIVLNRPQEPHPPFPYRCEDVKLDNTGAGVTLAGTLTIPNEDGRFPAVILVTGSGPQNRDEEILGHKPFLVIADHLTRNGIAVLRYDDRGTAESTGSFAGSTSEDFTWDALAAFDYLQEREEIDPSKIGVIGHSEGGTIAFMMASRQRELAFIVSMAGSLVGGDSTMVIQNAEMLALQGISSDLIYLYCTALKDVYAIKKSRSVAYISENLDNLTTGLAGYDLLPEAFQSGLKSVLKNTDPWFNFFISYDPTEDIAQTLCPVLAINGGKDFQVSAEVNLNHLVNVLDEAGNKRYVVRIYPDRNHLFQDCRTGDLAEYGQIEQTISPEVLEDITGWILSVTK